MKTPRFVFLDAGGTIIEIDFRHLREVMVEEGLSAGRGTGNDGLPSDAAFLAAGRDARAWYLGHVRDGSLPLDAWHGYFERVFSGAGIPAEALPGLLTRLWERNVRAGIWQRAVPGASGTLTRLTRRGLRLAVISNSEGRVAQDIAIAGLAHHFETIVDSGLVGVEKPDPRIFAIALERVGAAPDESVYVGDIYHIDVLGARSAGLRAILLDPYRLQLDADCPRIESLGELEGVLDRN